jgi:predicted nucleotidyltransferase
MPSKVYIFGSLVKETWDSDSDIDIAIEGVAIDNAAQIDRALKNAFGHVDFDIVFVEYAEKSLLGSILYEGEVIYEK